MKFRDLKRHFGSIAVASKRLRRFKQTIYRWQKGGIPLPEQVRIEVRTAGELRADGLSKLVALRLKQASSIPA